MKKIVFAAITAFAVFVIGCNNEEKKPAENLSQQQQADSLEQQVIEGHDVAMSKSMKIADIQAEVKRIIDSIAKLPAKAQSEAVSYRARLEEVYKELGDANASMEKWMDEFDLDSAKNDLEQRIKYLADEKLRVDKVKDAVLSSVEKANNLIKEKR
jgi:hypothetical protein